MEDASLTMMLTVPLGFMDRDGLGPDILHCPYLGTLPRRV